MEGDEGDGDSNLRFGGGVSEIIWQQTSKADWHRCRARVHSFIAVVLFIWLVVLCFEISPKLSFWIKSGLNKRLINHLCK